MTEEQILFLLRQNNAQFLAANAENVTSMRSLEVATDEAGLAMSRTTRRGYLMNQALFTTRRILYGLTLGLLAGGVAAFKWGFDFNNTMVSARTALQPLIPDANALNAELDTLFQLAKFSPFTFQDTTLAFRNMFVAMSTLGIGADTVNTTIQSIIDTLSVAGRTTPAALNRVAYALQHVAFQGRLTGQAVNQLGRDGIPVAAILRDEFHLTGEEIHNVGKLGIPTLTFLQAFNKYTRDNPVFSGAAARQSQNSFTGLFAQFKDSMSQIMGAVEKGFFTRVQHGLQRVNGFFTDSANAIKNSTNATQVVQALFPQLMPLWIQLAGAIHMFWVDFSLLVGTILHNKAIWATLYLALAALHIVLVLINPALVTMRYWLYIVVPLWVAFKTAQMISAIFTAANTVALVAENTAIKELTFAQFLLNLYTGKWAILTKLAAAATWIYTAAIYGAYAAEYAMGEISIWLRTQLAILWAIMALNPIYWIAAAVVLLVAGLVILYFKWKFFHDLVNRTWNWIVDHKGDIARAIMIAFAPLYTVIELLKHIQDLWNGLRSAFRWLTGSGHGPATGNRTQTRLGGFSGRGPIFHSPPGLASGGTVITPGLAWVGERGPELLSLPTGATVNRTDTSPQYNLAGSWMKKHTGGDLRPLRIQLMVGRRVLADVVAEEVQAQIARS